MLFIGIGFVFIVEDVLNVVENIGVEFVVLGCEILFDYDFVVKIKEGWEDEIINVFDFNCED